MKKTISILLSLLLLLSLAACVKVKTDEEPAAKDAPAAVATAAPTQAPTPEPTEVPFSVAVSEANEKLAKVNSMHMDMDITIDIDMALTMAMGGIQQSIPVDKRIISSVDNTKEPSASRAEFTVISGTESESGLMYVVRDGENVVQYTSMDGGETWKKTTNPTEENLPQSPTSTINLFSGMDAELIGTEEVNGKLAKVYTGKVEGKRLKEILNSSGVTGELPEAMGEDIQDALTNLSDISVALMIDVESGMPVRYRIDMTDAMKDLAAMAASMKGELPEGIEFVIDVTAVTIEITLSDFDSVEPIVVPEAALNTPEL